MNTDATFQNNLDETAQPSATSIETIRTGPSSRTMRLMAVVGLGAVGVATVAGFASMAGAQTDNHEPIVTLSEPRVSEPRTNMPEVEPTPELIETPFEPFTFEEDPNAVIWEENGEFYCPPCGMG